MKLLAKTAEERYQTAAGVEAALRRCLATGEALGPIHPFPLGTQDASDRLMIPEQLYGREREIDVLLASFDRVVTNGTPELVLVSGYSGIGKSSVVHELHKVLIPSRGLFASGKFDQYKRDIPYATLGQAFQSLVRPLLGQSEEELGRWRDALSEALGSNGQLIVNLVLAPVDLVAGNLRRFSVGTQEALKQFACLGNVAEVATLTVVHGVKEEAVHVALWEAVHAGLVFRLNSAYKFMHDRIQQAAYSLIPEEQRAEVHLRIGRVLLASMTADELAEHLFDVATQFNRGASRLVDRDEKAQVATIDLRTGQKAKASAAYASACVYFAAGTALLDERNWGSRYELMFDLWLERAECEFLSGNFDKAEQLIIELLQRGRSKVDQAGAYHLKVLLHTVKSENREQSPVRSPACACSALKSRHTRPGNRSRPNTRRSGETWRGAPSRT
jgi:predicted ATPase